MKVLFILLGLLFVAIAYIGILLPGVPTTFPALVALWCFSKSSRKLERWLKNNKLFGKYVREWQAKRIYPKAGKLSMYIVLIISNVVFLTRFPTPAFLSFLLVTIALIVWSLPYPENQAEYEELQQQARTRYSLRERLGKLFR